MHLKKVSTDAANWWRRRADNEGFLTRGNVSTWMFIEAIANGEYTIVKTSELEKLKKRS